MGLDAGTRGRPRGSAPPFDVDGQLIAERQLRLYVIYEPLRPRSRDRNASNC